MDESGAPTVEGFVEYCRTQAGLLAGTAEELRAETDALLDDIDAEMADLRAQLEGEGADGPETPETTTGPGPDVDVAALEDREADIAQQALAEAKSARLEAFQELATGYADLAVTLQDAADDEAALERVLEFEADHDAPAYFPDRQTVLEAALADE